MSTDIHVRLLLGAVLLLLLSKENFKGDKIAPTPEVHPAGKDCNYLSNESNEVDT